MVKAGITTTGGGLVSIECAFCRGTGKDPFGVMSILSACQVCGGRGTVAIGEPFANCAFCKGSGIHPFHRLTCTACGGKGVVPVAGEGEKTMCPECGGSGGSHPNGNVPCLLCKGKGFVYAKGGQAD